MERLNTGLQAKRLRITSPAALPYKTKIKKFEEIKKVLDFAIGLWYNIQRCSNVTHKYTLYAPVAELADAHGSGPCARKGMGVQVSPGAPLKTADGNAYFRQLFCIAESI